MLKKKGVAVMAIEMIEKQVLSSDNDHRLVGRAYIPEGTPRGLFQVVHGMTEHIGRYEGFMREMAADGFIVFGYDHLGHGLTARGPEELGFIAHKDGWRRLVEDVYRFGAAMKEEYGPDLPFVLMGHSMGSFIVRLTAAQYPMADKLIVMGTGGPNPMGGVGLAVIKCIKAFKGERHISNTVDKLAFGAYNKRCEEDGKYGWLTKDADIRAAYAADPFCTFRFTVSAMEDLLRLNGQSNRKDWAASLPKGLPVLLVSGCEDPVGSYGAGVKAVEGMLAAAGIPVETHLYENCRHEILNDTCREQVIADIRRFVTA